MTRITVGQYYPVDSVVHRLDPRVKLFGVMAYIILLFIAGNFAGYLAAGIFVCAVIALAKVPPGLLLRGLRSVLFRRSYSKTARPPKNQPPPPKR